MNLRPFPLERQLDKKDCGAACLKMIAKHYGKFYSLQYLRDKCGTTRDGVSLVDLSYASENIGIRSIAINCSITDLSEKILLPCILHWKSNHFIVVYKLRNNKVYVADPAKGLITYNYEDFVKNWYKANEETGTVLVLEPMADFKQREESERIERLKTLQNFLGYFRPYKKSFINLGLVMLIATLLQALLPFITKSVIDVGIQTRDVKFINIVLIGNICIVVCVMFSNIVRNWILLHVTARINIAIISDFLIKLMKLPVSFFENKMVGDILQRANDHERIRSFIMNNGLGMIFSTLTFVIFGAILAIFNTVIFEIFIIGSILYVLWVFAFLKIRKKLDWEYFELTAKNQSYWVETVNSMQDIKINNYEVPKRWKWEKIQSRIYRVNNRVLSINDMQNTGAQLIDSLKNLSITFYCAKAVVAGEITFGVMISTQFMIGMLNGPVVQFIQFIVAAQVAQISFLRLNEIHSMKDEGEDYGTNTIALPTNKSITLKNVSFKFTPSSPLVLKNINLTIPEGKLTAFVGDSGSGKSTLLKLILRLYTPSFGDIMLGNMNISNVSLRQWRDVCGAVMQDGKIFNDMILNNIVLDDENIDYDKLKNAVETANIANEIEKLPLGYQTTMGEMGRGLSGGQKQRLLIARALYKNPDYLFFDEATNALDTINERKIVDALEKVFQNRTVVVVAHRLSTIRKADQIVVMQEGFIVEVGNHESLMAKGGRYFQLIQSQTEMISSINIERPSQN
ncbi:MAG: peptidase domain-containing ABC transporter [Mucilaginibacter sp.]|uniref:peptidase domain-containing ABC transporter n=1 Tax=Mucilaginibacter sp. TaxID=1882438 RepID=UPI0032674E59